MGIWETLSRPWQVSVEQAWEAYCANSIPIGAVVTDAEDNILAVGRNRIHDEIGEIEDQLYGMPLAHAEMNALLSLNYKSTDLQSAILYTTSEPCPLCVGGIYMAGVRELRYASRDPYTGSVQILQATPYLRKKHIRVIGPEEPRFEHLLITWLVEYKMKITDKDYKKVIDVWKSVYPQAVEDGEKVYESGELDSLRQDGASAQVFFDRLETLIA